MTDKIVLAEPDWLAREPSEELRELLLDLCAQGMPDVEVARQLRKSGLINKCTPEDVGWFRSCKRADIRAYINKHGKAILSETLHADKTYRIGALDKLLNMLQQRIIELMEENELKDLSPLIGHYIKALQSISEVTTEASVPAGDPTNWMVETLQKLPAEKQEEFLEHILAAEKIANDVGVERLPDPHVVDAEFEAEDAQEDDGVE